METFGPEGLPEIKVNGNKITFTTDSQNFKVNFEDAIETLFSRFNIDKFQIAMHHHPGDKHDKDISFETDNIQEVVQFIQENFYN